MKNRNPVLCLLFLLILSCSKENNSGSDFTFPQKFSFKKSELTKEQVYLIGDNEAFSKVIPYNGYLDSLKNNIVLNYYHFVKDSIKSFFIESFELLNKDSIKIEYSQAGSSGSLLIPADVNNTYGEIIDSSVFETKIIWERVKKEISYCVALKIGIVQRGNLKYIDFDQYNCSSNDPDAELKLFLQAQNYSKNDTLGIYLLNMIYQ